MATQKRRVIYLSDEDWSLARGLADDTGMTISTVIRALLADRARPGELPRLDAIRAEEGPKFNSRPFTPVPKKGR